MSKFGILPVKVTISHYRKSSRDLRCTYVIDPKGAISRHDWLGARASPATGVLAWKTLYPTSEAAMHSMLITMQINEYFILMVCLKSCRPRTVLVHRELRVHVKMRPYWYSERD